MEDEHVRIRHQISAQKRKETIQETDLKKTIRTQEERGSMNLTMTDRNLLKAKIDYVMEDFRNIKTRKNELVDGILKLLHKTVKAKMEKGKVDRLNKMEEKLEEERASYNKRYEDLVRELWSQAEMLVPQQPQYMQPPQNAPHRGKEFQPNPDSSPGKLMQDMRPVEVTEWKRRFQDYLQDGMQMGKKPSSDLIKRQLIRLSDDYWMNRISHLLKDGDTWESYAKVIDNEMEILFPTMGRRDMLVTMTQKQGQMFSDYYRALEKQG